MKKFVPLRQPPGGQAIQKIVLEEVKKECRKATIEAQNEMFNMVVAAFVVALSNEGWGADALNFITDKAFMQLECVAAELCGYDDLLNLSNDLGVEVKGLDMQKVNIEAEDLKRYLEKIEGVRNMKQNEMVIKEYKEATLGGALKLNEAEQERLIADIAAKTKITAPKVIAFIQAYEKQQEEIKKLSEKMFSDPIVEQEKQKEDKREGVNTDSSAQDSQGEAQKGKGEVIDTETEKDVTTQNKRNKTMLQVETIIRGGAVDYKIIDGLVQIPGFTPMNKADFETFIDELLFVKGKL